MVRECEEVEKNNFLHDPTAQILSQTKTLNIIITIQYTTAAASCCHKCSHFCSTVAVNNAANVLIWSAGAAACRSRLAAAPCHTLFHCRCHQCSYCRCHHGSHFCSTAVCTSTATVGAATQLPSVQPLLFHCCLHRAGHRLPWSVRVVCE